MISFHGFYERRAHIQLGSFPVVSAAPRPHLVATKDHAWGVAVNEEDNLGCRGMAEYPEVRRRRCVQGASDEQERIGKASLGGWCIRASDNAPILVGQIKPRVMRTRMVDSCRCLCSGLCSRVVRISAEVRHIRTEIRVAHTFGLASEVEKHRGRGNGRL